MNARRDFPSGARSGHTVREVPKTVCPFGTSNSSQYSRTSCPIILAGSAPGLGLNFWTRPPKTSGM